MADVRSAGGRRGEIDPAPGGHVGCALDCVGLPGDSVKLQPHSAAGLFLDLQPEDLGGIAGKGPRDVFKPVALPVAVKISLRVDQAEIPTVCSGVVASLVELPLFPYVRQSVQIVVRSQRQIQSFPFGSASGSQGSGNLDRVEQGTVHRYRQAELSSCLDCF